MGIKYIVRTKSMGAPKIRNAQNQFISSTPETLPWAVRKNDRQHHDKLNASCIPILVQPPHFSPTPLSKSLCVKSTPSKQTTMQATKQPSNRATKHVRCYTDLMVNHGHDGSMRICPYRDHRKAGLNRFYTDRMVNNAHDGNRMICSCRDHRKAGLKLLANTDLTLNNIGLGAPQNGNPRRHAHSTSSNRTRSRTLTIVIIAAILLCLQADEADHIAEIVRRILHACARSCSEAQSFRKGP
jgi:hypothetical protein